MDQRAGCAREGIGAATIADGIFLHGACGNSSARSGDADFVAAAAARRVKDILKIFLFHLPWRLVGHSNGR
jgi:hypothetical protein